MIKTSLSIDRSHTHGKTLRPTPSIVNIYSIDMTKYEEGFSAESIVMSDPKRSAKRIFFAFLASWRDKCFSVIQLKFRRLECKSLRTIHAHDSRGDEHGTTRKNWPIVRIDRSIDPLP